MTLQDESRIVSQYPELSDLDFMAAHQNAEQCPSGEGTYAEDFAASCEGILLTRS